MTPNPNPSPELHEAMRLIEYDMLNRRRDHDGFIGERKEVSAIITALRAALSPQTLPAPGEVELRLKYDAPQGTGRFEVLDPEPNNHHSALYLVDPNGAMFNISCWNEEGVDNARGQWMRDTLNAALSGACESSPDAPYVWRLDRGESESLFAALHGLTCSRDIQDIPLVMESVTDIFRSTMAGDGTRQRPLSDFDNIAESITNSDPLMGIYAAVEWDELDDNGKDWVRALVRETMARVSSGYVVGLADAAEQATRVGDTSAEDTEHPATSRAVGHAIASTIRSLVPSLATVAAANDEGERSARMREAIDAGLRAFCSDTSDFTMSSAMRRAAADFIIGQPGMFALATSRSQHEGASS